MNGWPPSTASNSCTSNTAAPPSAEPVKRPSFRGVQVVGHRLDVFTHVVQALGQLCQPVADLPPRRHVTPREGRAHLVVTPAWPLRLQRGTEPRTDSHKCRGERLDGWPRRVELYGVRPYVLRHQWPFL